MSLPAAYFDHLYSESSDPWSLAQRWYEERKYALTIASLPSPRFQRAFEPGCSVGVLTSMLAERCDVLVASDVAEQALVAARRRVGERAGVTLTKLAVPDEWPDGTFDLVMISEIGYYLSPSSLTTLLDRAVDSLCAGGSLVAVHWRHHVEAYPLSGDDVHTVLRADDRLVSLAEHTEHDFLLDVRVKPPFVSVAAAEGLPGA